MLTASADKTARLWDPETGNCKQVLEGHTDEIFSCAFNYEGNTIITGRLGFCVWGCVCKRKMTMMRSSAVPLTTRGTPSSLVGLVFVCGGVCVNGR